ncbi:MAG: ribulose-phosphate 3-epimerase [Chlamydiales bacterium]
MSSNKKIKVAPSILAGDFAHIAREVERIEESGADAIHIDIMDGHFVPNITMGPQMVAAINRNTQMFLDVHLMIYNPFDYIERFVESGADQITFHFEATEDVEETLDFIGRCGIRKGLAFCPETTVSLAVNYLTKCDNLLMMTVHPGFGGQKFMDEVVPKIEFLRETCNKLSIKEGGVIAKSEKEAESLGPLDIQVDGGINLETAKIALQAGANSIVAGTFLFKQEVMADAVTALRDCAEGS